MNQIQEKKPASKKPCCGELTAEMRDVLGLLGTCARQQGNELQYCRLVKQSDALRRWEDLPRHAEEHRLAPLAFLHLSAIDALIPEQPRRELKALVLRQQHASQMRSRALSEILPAFEQQAVPVMLLKGAALAQLVYAQPGMRPMGDLDLLVRKSDLPRAQQILSSLGYAGNAELRRITPAAHHHLPGMERTFESLPVCVELHHNLFPRTIYYPSLSYEALIQRSIPLDVNGVAARTLGYEDMLYHVYRHAAGPPLLISPLRLIWIADLVSLVEKFIDQIDWRSLRRRYPQVWNILPLLHYVTPWSEKVLARLDLDLRHEPAGVAQPYTGWPRTRWRPKNAKWNRRLLGNTFNPPEWWLRWYYGTGSALSRFWVRWLRHPLHILEWRVHFWKEEIRRYGFGR